MGGKQKRIKHLDAPYRGAFYFIVSLIVWASVYTCWTNRKADTSWSIKVDEGYVNCLIDSMIEAHNARLRPKVYPFNPNYLDAYRGYRIGLSSEEVDRIKHHRLNGNWINSAEEFRSISGVSDSLFRELRPLLKFPYWTTIKRSPARATPEFDLNKASADELRAIRGVGEVLSKRILALRERLGGFAHYDELYAVYGLTAEVIERIIRGSSLDQPRVMQRLNVNTASASDMATIPGISFEMARSIWVLRRENGTLTNLDPLGDLPHIGPRELRLIELYLKTE